jgi:hypothetical protein
MRTRKLVSTILLLLLAGGAAGGPLIAHALMTDLRLRRGLQAWWVGAEYLDERNVIRQQTDYDCGVVCLQMVLCQRKIATKVEELRAAAGTRPGGTSLLGLKQAAEAKGLQASVWRLSWQDLLRAPLPAVAFSDGHHFVVLEEIDANGGVIALDPARGRLRYRDNSFIRHWRGEVLCGGSWGHCFAGETLSGRARAGARACPHAAPRSAATGSACGSHTAPRSRQQWSSA